MVHQVMVVESSAGSDRFEKIKDLQQRLAFDELKDLSTNERLNVISEVLREAEIRYASINADTCHKLNGFNYNYNFISKWKKGLKGLLLILDELEAEQDIVKYLINNLKFIKSKSAKDYFRGLGVNKNTIAIAYLYMNLII